MRLIGKTAVVLGGSRGIGRGIVEGLVAEGAQVVSLARTAGDDFVVPNGHQRPRFRACDVTDLRALETSLREVGTELGGFDIVVNNAGTNLVGSILEVTAADLDAMWALNTRSVLLATRWAAEQMIAWGRPGSIVNITSSAATRAYRERVGYCASKAAVLMASKSAALDLAEHGIRVNCVAPGAVDTPLLRALHTDAGSGEAERAAAVAEFGRGLAPLGRVGHVRDIAAAVLYLASDESAWVTGSQLHVDGGITA